MTELTDKQEKFCQEFVVDCCAAAAARRAGYSEDTAKQQASRLLTNPAIKVRISQLKQEQAKLYQQRIEINADYLKSKIQPISESNMADFARIEDGRLIVTDTDQLPREMWELVSEIQETKFGIKVKFHDKNKAIDMLNRHAGFYEADNNQQGEQHYHFRFNAGTDEDYDDSDE